MRERERERDRWREREEERERETEREILKFGIMLCLAHRQAWCFADC